MKNLVGYFIAFALGIGVYWGISRYDSSTTKESDTSNLDPVIRGSQKLVASADASPIERRTANELLTNYLHKMGDYNSTYDGKATQYFAFRLDSLYSLINKYRGLKASGLRIYPGIYPRGTKHDFPNIEGADVSSMLTIFIVPTDDSLKDGKLWPHDMLAHPPSIMFIDNETTQCPPPKCPKFGATLLAELYGADQTLIYKPTY